MNQNEARSWRKELLTIIAVILILLPILACAVHRAREASEQQTCTENLKRLGVAAEMYQTDWDDVLVPYGSPAGWTPTGRFWPELLNAYVRRIPGAYTGANLPREFQCPSRLDETAFAYERTYGINLYCGGWFPGGPPVVVAVKSVKYPQATIRIAEDMWRAQGGSFFAAQPTQYSAGDPTGHRFAARHDDKGNVLWIDGHVSVMTLEQYNLMDTQANRNVWLRLNGPKPAVP